MRLKAILCRTSTKKQLRNAYYKITLNLLFQYQCTSGAGVVICLELGADLHMAQLMPLPLTVSCFSKIQIGFAFLVPAQPGSPGKRAVKRVCVCVYKRQIFQIAESNRKNLFGSEIESNLFCPNWNALVAALK